MSLIRNSALLTLGLLAGRLIGYVRELLIANKYGVTAGSDTIILALTIPEFVSNILSTGLATNVIVPRLHGLNAEEIEHFLKHSWKKILLISVIGYIVFSFYVILAFEFSIAIILILSCLSVFPNAMTSVNSAYLTFKEKFKTISISNVVFNIFATISIFIFENIYLITAGFFIAAIARFYATWGEARSSSYTSDIWKFHKLETTHSDVTLGAFFYSALSSGLVLLNPLINRLFAASLPDGAVSVLSYAEKLYLLPMTVLISPYLTASFSKFSREVILDEHLVLEKVHRYLGLILLISMPVVIIGFFFSNLLIQITFGLAGLGISNQQLISSSFQAFLPSLIFSSFSMVLINVFFTLKKEKIILVTSLLSVFINAIGNFFVVRYFPNVSSLALMTSATSMFVFGMQYTILRLNMRKA